MGWAGKSNGELLGLAGPHFDVFVTIDAGIQYQQNLSNTSLSVVLLHARSNKLEDLEPLVPALLDRLRGLGRGELVTIRDTPR